MNCVKGCNNCKHGTKDYSEFPCNTCNTYTKWTPKNDKIAILTRRPRQDLSSLLCDDELPDKEGLKYDSGKLPLHLVPPEAIEGLAEVLSFGAQKYGERNWEEGIKWSRVFSAAQRHMTTYLKGERLDPESKKSHLKHALANLAFLVTFEERGLTSFDDLPSNNDF